MILPAEYAARMKRLLGADYDRYVESLARPPVRGITVNTDKISADEFARNFGFPIKPSGFSDDCFILTDDVKTGRSPFHHGGAVYVQEPGAMLPVIAADLRGDERVLDLCAAPGGKTVQAAKKAAFVLANDVDYGRAGILAGNVERMGFRNVAVCSHYPDYLENAATGFFDVVIVDAPCSGEGMFRKEPAALGGWSEQSVAGCAARQKEILVSADKMLREGGKLIYSTCTFSVEENEEAAAFLVNKMGYELIAPASAVIPYSRGGVCVSGLNGEFMRRVYPHDGVGEGQFFAVLRKTSGGAVRHTDSVKLGKADGVRGFISFRDEYLTAMPEVFRAGEDAVVPAGELPAKIRYLSYGVTVGSARYGSFKPSHNLFSAMWRNVKNHFDADRVLAEKYLRGEEIEGGGSGWLTVKYCGIPLGGGKAADGVIKNHYPKGLRNK